MQNNIKQRRKVSDSLLYRIFTLIIIGLLLNSCVLLSLIRDRIPQPYPVEGGIKFQFYAPYATSVYIAGDFNNWGDNTNGIVTDPRWKLHDDDNDGVWTIIIRIAPGKHKYKFVVNGRDWVKDPNAKEDENHDNSVIIVR